MMKDVHIGVYEELVLRCHERWTTLFIIQRDEVAFVEAISAKWNNVFQEVEPALFIETVLQEVCYQQHL